MAPRGCAHSVVAMLRSAPAASPASREATPAPRSRRGRQEAARGAKPAAATAGRTDAASDLPLPALDVSGLARRAALPALAVAGLAAAVIAAGGPLRAFAEALGRALAAPWRGEVDVVVGPAMGGVIIGHEVARALGVRMVFTERSGGAMALRRSFEVGAGERALIVENVVTTGGSALEVAELLHGGGATVAGLATIVDRLPAGARLPLPYRALARIDADAWAPQECPVCTAGTEAESPGSRGLADRAK